MRKILGALLMNPSAGTLSDEERSELASRASAAGLEVIPIGRGVEVASLIRQRRKTGTELFVVAGGDGSVHSASQALVGTSATLAVVPVGSLNHFAHDLGIPLAWREAPDVALHGRVHTIDAGRVHDRYFVNNVLMGVGPRISEYRERYRRRMGNWRAYLKAVHIALRHLPRVSLFVKSDEGTVHVRTQLFVVSVDPDDLSRFGLLAPRVALDAGSLYVYWARPLTRAAFVLAAARYFLGLAKPFEDFQAMSTKRLRVESRRRHLRASADGELLSLPSSVEISIVPSSLRVKLPR